MKKPLPNKKFFFSSRAIYEEASYIIGEIKKILEENGREKEFLYKIELILEEILLNICRYAYPPGEIGEVEVILSLGEKEISLTFEDQGKPFNPLEFKPKIIQEDDPLEELEPGGLGIFLVKEMAKKVSYEHRKGRNILTIIL